MLSPGTRYRIGSWPKCVELNVRQKSDAHVINFLGVVHQTPLMQNYITVSLNQANFENFQVKVVPYTPVKVALLNNSSLDIFKKSE